MMVNPLVFGILFGANTGRIPLDRRQAEDADIVKFCRNLLSLKPAAYLAEQDRPNTKHRYSFFNAEGRVIATYECGTDVLHFDANHAGDTVSVQTMSGYNRGVFAQEKLALVRAIGVAYEEQTKSPSRYPIWHGDSLYSTQGGTVQRLGRTGPDLRWQWDDLYSGKASYLYPAENEAFWLAIEPQKKDQVNCTYHKFVPGQNPQPGQTFGEEKQSAFQSFAATPWVAIAYNENIQSHFIGIPKIAFLNPNTNQRIVADGTGIFGCRYLPGLDSILFLAGEPDNHVDRFQFGLFETKTGKVTKVKLSGRLILDYQVLDDSKVIAITEKGEPTSKDGMSFGGGQQGGRQLPENYFDPKPRELIIVDVTSGSVRVLGKLTDELHPFLRKFVADD